MKSFKFSEQEIELLIAMYEDELKEVTDYTDRLRETLRKLRSDAPSGETGAPVREGKKRGRKPGQKNAKKPAATGKKRGRKPKSATPAALPVQPETSAAPKAVKEKKAVRRKTKKSKKIKKAPVVKKTEISPVKVEKGTEPII